MRFCRVADQDTVASRTRIQFCFLRERQTQGAVLQYIKLPNRRSTWTHERLAFGLETRLDLTNYTWDRFGDILEPKGIRFNLTMLYHMISCYIIL